MIFGDLVGQTPVCHVFFMTDPQPRRRWQFSLRAVLVLVTLLAVALAFYTNRHRRVRHAIDVLNQQEISYGLADPQTLPWYDRWSWIAPPRIESISIYGSRNKDLAIVAPLLADLGTVKRLSYDDLSVSDVKLLSQVKSIERIEASWGLTADHVRPFLTHSLVEFEVRGADMNIPPDALELLFTMPSLKRVGTAHGSSAVPKHLQAQRPDISIFVTDFPP